MSVNEKHQGKRALVAGFVAMASLSKPSLALLQLRKCSPLAFAMYLLLAFCGVCRGQGLESLDRGHRVLVEKGLQLEALAFTNETGYFDVDRWAESNFTTLTTYCRPYNTSILPSTPPGIPWSRWLGAEELGDPANADLYSWEKPFASNLIHLDVKDEQDMTDPVELAIAAAAVDSFHAKYPDVIMNTTQWGSQHTAAQLQNYMQIVEPDMLMFDTYPFDGSTAGGSPTELYRDMEKYRKLGLAGNDGTGTRPIPTALYTQTYIRNGHVVSESEIRLNAFSALAFGNKLLNSFVYDNPQHNPGVVPVMFSGDGTVSPTAQFYQVAETNRQAGNLGPALVRLISTDVRMIMGRHKQWLWEVDNDLPDGVSSWTAAAATCLSSIRAPPSWAPPRGRWTTPCPAMRGTTT